MRSLARGTAREIEIALVRAGSAQQRALLDAFTIVDERSDAAVFGFGTRVALANPRAQDYAQQDRRALEFFAHDFGSGRSTHWERLRLPSGRQVVVTEHSVWPGDLAAGVVLEVNADPTASDRDVTGEPYRRTRDGQASAVKSRAASAPPRAAGPTPVLTTSPTSRSRSPLWRRACDDMFLALRRNDPVLVVGQSGTGRSTLVTQVFHTLRPTARWHVVEPAELVATALGIDLGGGPDGDPVSDPGPGDDGPAGLYVFRNIHLLDAAGVRALEEVAARAAHDPQHPRLAATVHMSALADGATFAGLLQHFVHAVWVPSLRQRAVDIPDIARQVLGLVSPSIPRTLTPAALAALRGASWPGNLPQLRDALERACRIAGERNLLTLQDLTDASYCTASRHLTPLQQSERDTVVLALQEQDGNRAAAARALGMSRATLYRKIRAYGLSDT